MLQRAEAVRDSSVAILVQAIQVVHPTREFFLRKPLHILPGRVHELDLKLPSFGRGHLCECPALFLTHHDGL